ncbi:unnamed protein product [Lupinus luteus]|uniref:PHD-type zinc finger plants domain-containing protein n=1 Tax=Lupinus luteus TaxID=3873 RepID=A0AAV1X2P1_LUPLU
MTSIETNTTRQSNTVCCMCGDPGFSDQLFQCKICHFRSQHRYCSNIYPKLESLGTCNWCLNQKESDKSSNTSNSSSPYRNNDDEDDENNKSKKIRKGLRWSTSALQLQLQKKPIKKLHKSPEARSPSTASTSPSSQSVLISTRKRVVTNGASEDIANRNGGASKQVFRNKGRRYKLLDEVSS